MMNYFENDPLQQVYADLAKNKPPRHFDTVLALTGFCQAAFELASQDKPLWLGQSVNGTKKTIINRSIHELTETQREYNIDDGADMVHI